MTLADLPAAAAAERACFADPWSESSFRASLANADQHFFCAEEDGVLLGFAGCWLMGDEAEVLNVAVLPHARRQGIGSALLDTVLADCRENGVGAVHLEVRASNEAARALYAQKGFVQDGLRPRYYTNPREDAVLMTRLL